MEPHFRVGGREKTLARVLVAGDFCPGKQVLPLLAGEQAEEFWGDIISITGSHDLNIVNLECPLTSRESPIPKIGPNLRADPACLAGLRTGGFNLVGLANNHILDMGWLGLLDTMRHCRSAGLDTVGAGADLFTASAPFITSINGVNIHILTIADAEFSAATDEKGGAYPLDEIDNHYKIRAASEKSDFVLVILHSGNESYDLPSPRLVKVCRFFVKSGANAVVCHHSHVPTGFEWFQGAPIFYGVGNFVFDQPSLQPPEWYNGYLVSLEIAPKLVHEARMIPYKQCSGGPTWKLLGEHDSTAMLKMLGEKSKIISDPAALERKWRDFCLKSQNHYWARLFSRSAIGDQLWIRGLRTPRHLRKRLALILNLVHCQAHRDVLIELLNAAHNRFGEGRNRA